MKPTLLLALTLLAGPAALAQSSATVASVGASATIYSAITLTNSQALNFGIIVPDTASQGTVTLDATATATRTPTGAISAGGSTYSAAKFTVTGHSGAQFNLTLPTSVTLSSGSNSMTLDTFTSSLSNPATLTGGSLDFYVGAKLAVGQAQADGAYSGSFSVTVAYN